MIVQYYFITDKGKAKMLNEDAVKISENLNLFVIADGMGGHSAGEIASSLAIDTVTDFIQKAKLYNPDLDKNKNSKEIAPSDFFSPEREIENGIRFANTVIYDYAKRQEKLRGMGTTIITGLFFKNYIYIGSVGDSRVYLIRNKNIYQITKDDVLDEKNALRKNVITNALGRRTDLDIKIYSLLLSPKDIIIACSDGLYKVVSDNEILNSILKFDLNLEELCPYLIKLAYQKGAPDNISIVLAKVSQLEENMSFANAYEKPQVIEKTSPKAFQKPKKNIFSFKYVFPLLLLIIFSFFLIFNLFPKKIENKIFLKPNPDNLFENIEKLNMKLEINGDDYNVEVLKGTKEFRVTSNKKLSLNIMKQNKDLLLNFYALQKKPLKIVLEGKDIKTVSFNAIMPAKQKVFETTLQVYSESFLQEEVKKEKYEKAKDLMDEREFVKAKEIFSELGDFMDSNKMYDICKKLLELNNERENILKISDQKLKSKKIKEFNLSIKKFGKYIDPIKEELFEKEIKETVIAAKNTQEKQVLKEPEKNEFDVKLFLEKYDEAIQKISNKNRVAYSILKSLKKDYEEKEKRSIIKVSRPKIQFYYFLAKAAQIRCINDNDQNYCNEADNYLLQSKTEGEIGESEINSFKKEYSNE